MTSFPASPTSSSDLYPNSEPAGEAQTYSLHPHSPGRELEKLGIKYPRSDVGTPTHAWSGDAKVSQDLHNARYEAVQASSKNSAHAPGISDDNLPHGSHKRKREGDADDSRFVPGKLPSLGLVESLPYPSESAKHDSLKNYFSNNNNEVSPSDWSNNKRTKPNNISSGSALKTSIPYQSSGLPAKLWQRVFCFVPPVFLGRLLRVNKAFNAYLTPGDSNEPDMKRTVQGIAKPLSPEAVWASSRRRFCPGLPKPMRGLKELDMWRLLRGHNCQICGEPKASSPVPNLESPWESGPGEMGVRVIWPWSVRVCGQCIQKCSEKEVSLLFTSISALLPALPFAFISISNHYIPSNALRSTTPPLNLQLTKYYFKPHIEEIKQRLEHARGLGDASAEEWIKGLDSEGKERLNEVSRWEQWDARGGLRKVNLRPHPKAIIPPASVAIRSKGNEGKSEGIKNEGSKQEPASGVHNKIEDTKKDVFQYEHIKNGLPSGRSTPQGIRFPTKPTWESCSPVSSTSILTPIASASFQPTWISSTSNLENLLPRQPAPFQPPRLERSIREANEAKANRKAEIERRCAALDPPLVPKVLAHMETFQAAIQIPRALNDQAWNMLKPRLLAQRVYAERREKEIFEQGQLLQAEYQQRRQQEAQLKETKESLDREWDNVQTPIRNQITEMADERIERKWNGGKTVTKDNSPQFAADVLLYVRQRFYNEIAQEDEKTTATSRNSRFDTGPPSRILILENMKWLFDTKIKPLTENFQKELFLCNGCDGNFKFYGLESVVQHYAAKHTTALSCGPQVVSWRAEWPEHPLFNPTPSVAQADYYKIPPPLISSLPTPVHRDSETLNRIAGYGQIITPSVQATSDFSPASRKPADFPPTSDLGVGYPGLHTSHSDFRSPSVSASQISNYQATAYNGLEFSQVRDPKMPIRHESESSAMTSHHARPSAFYSPHPVANGDIIAQTASLYQFQLDEMAKHARDVWTATSGIKDIPQSVRIFVVIQQTVARFKKTFSNEPSLSMFLDGLDHNVLMRPIRNQKGLACKVCVTSGSGSGAGGGQNSYTQLAVKDRWLFQLPQLLNHFQTLHLDSQLIADPMVNAESRKLDWKFDLIELPESHLIAALMYASGIDDAKLELIAKAFPRVFPSPLPRMGVAGNAGPMPIFPLGFDRGRPSQGVTPETYPDSPPKIESRSEPQLINRPNSSLRELSQPARSSEPPGEDEYDPRWPAFLEKIVQPGMSIHHLRNSSRNIDLGNSDSSLLRPKHEDNIYTANITGYPPSSFSRPPHRGAVNDNRSDQHNENVDTAQRSLSPERLGSSLSGTRFKQESPNRREQHSTGESNIPAKNNHISEDGEVKDSSTFLNTKERSLSAQEGTSAADAFLENLAMSNPGLRRNLAPPDRGEYRPTNRSQEFSQDLHPQIQSDTATEESDWRIKVSRQRHDTDLPTIPVRTDSLKGKNYDEPSMPQRPASNYEYEMNYPSKPRLHRPLTESLIGRRTPDIYATFEAPSRKIAQDRYDMGEAIMEVPRPGDGAFHVTRASQYRSRSRSPRSIPIGTTYYRARTPVNEGRVHDSFYHIHSPPVRNDIRSQRIISYDYPPQDRFEYVDDRRPPDNAIRQRVEYVPVRIEEHASTEPSRFVIAQPAEMRPQPDYVRLDRGYSGEPVYEHHGQLYHADPRPYHAPQNHGASTFAQGYRY